MAVTIACLCSTEGEEELGAARAMVRRLVVGLPPRRLGLYPSQSQWDLWWTDLQCAVQ
jgi:hypothetical protein